VAPDPIRQPKPATPPNQVHLAGRGLALSGPADMPVSVRSLDADVIDLTPDTPLTLDKSQLDIRLHQVDLAVPADRLAAFVQSQLHVKAIQNFKLSFQAPNQAIATGTVTLGGKPTPMRLEGQLLAVNGRLGFKPTTLATQIAGFDMRWRPQDGKAEVDATDKQLMDLLLPKLKSDAISNIAWQIQPNNQVHATATVQIAKKPAALDLQSELATQDGQLALLAKHATLDWRGLTMEADPLDRQAQIRGSQEAVTQIIRDELDIDKVRGMDFKFHPGNRISATGEVLESGAWRPVSIEGKLEAKDGALRIVPETASIQGVKGGLDIVAHPQTGQAEASITEQALNDLLGPLAAKKGFEHLNVHLLDGNQVSVEGEKVDPDHPESRKRVKLEGQLALNGDGEPEIARPGPAGPGADAADESLGSQQLAHVLALGRSIGATDHANCMVHLQPQPEGVVQLTITATKLVPDVRAGVTIRMAADGDARALRRLAALDSTSWDGGRALVAEVGGEL
jgi:hypothetical protein